MKVEIDAADVEYGLYYRDEKCKEVEKILKTNSKYAECEVKRVQWGDVNTNPFDVVDQNEESIVVLETWEIEALAPSELLSYIEVKQKIDQPLSDRDAMLYGAFGALGLTTITLVILSFFYGPQTDLNFIAIPVYILTPILGFLSVRTYRKTIQESNNADLEAARDDQSFTEILRKLAQVPVIEEYIRKKFVKRIERIEGDLTGFTS